MAVQLVHDQGGQFRHSDATWLLGEIETGMVGHRLFCFCFLFFSAGR
jgi:hypothetical protein